MILREVHLMADSKKKAYYHLKIEQISDGYLIRKESGIMDGRRLHCESYFRESYEDALSFYSKKIKQKTRLKRDRVYSVVFEV